MRIDLSENLNNNKTHLPLYADLARAVQELKSRFLGHQKEANITIEEVSFILEDLANCELGQHILLAGGSNGIWTDYLISPEQYLQQECLYQKKLSMVERFFLFSSPAVLAQRELHKTLQNTAQRLLGDGKIFASIPCGLMRDLLSLDYSAVKDISLVGIDIDLESIEASKKLALQKGVEQVTYSREDAWSLKYRNEFDFISSVGLNMYESDTEKVINLYSRFFDALKPGGILFTGILTYPPYIDPKKSDWNTSLIPKYDMHFETVIHRDILDIKWFNFRTISEAADDFKKAGFTKVEVKPDSRSIFPTIIATK